MKMRLQLFYYQQHNATRKTPGIYYPTSKMLYYMDYQDLWKKDKN
jgi:hypothetical protein